MTIYSADMYEKQKHFSWAWERAALDVHVPSRLIDEDDREEWRNYLSVLPPAQQLRKFAQALDQLHTLMQDVTDPLALPEKDQIAIFSKFQAAYTANYFVSERFNFAREEDMYPGQTDIGRGISYVVDLLKGINSPDAKVWEDRHVQHEALYEVLDPLLTKELQGGFRNKAPSPKSPRGPAP